MIVLDTHIWLWWMNNDQLSLVAARRKQIEEAEVIAVSAISCFEVAWLEQHQRISLPCPTVEWLEKSLHQSGICFRLRQRLRCVRLNCMNITATRKTELLLHRHWRTMRS
jgi:PIN domain nuclease of toxin-antitoxin system